MSGTHQPDPPETDIFVRTLMDEAMRVEAAEAVLKRAVIEAAQRGDCARVEHIVSRWIQEPPVAVAASLIDASDPR